MKELKALYFPELAVMLPIDELIFTAPVIDDGLYDDIKLDIAEGKLAFPIVSIRCEGREWNRLTRMSELEKAPTEEGEYYFVSCGNNRGRVAKELGYTHISSLVFPEFHLGSSYCSRMRKWYVEREYRRDLGLFE